MRALKWVLLLAAFAAIAWVAAIKLDLHVAQWVLRASPIKRGGWLAFSLRSLGFFPVTIGIAIVVGIFHRRHWQAAIPLLVAGPLVGISYAVLKWAVGRSRPIKVIAPFELHPFADGLHGLIHARSGLSFPSGDATMAFATATCLAFILPRWAPVFFVIAVGVMVERVLENAHYVSDVVAGAGLGILCGVMAWKIVERFMETGRHREEKTMQNAK